MSFLAKVAELCKSGIEVHFTPTLVDVVTNDHAVKITMIDTNLNLKASHCVTYRLIDSVNNDYVEDKILTVITAMAESLNPAHQTT